MSKYLESLKAEMFQFGIIGPVALEETAVMPLHGLIVPDDASSWLLRTAERGFWSATDECDKNLLRIASASGFVIAHSPGGPDLVRYYETGFPLDQARFQGLQPQFDPEFLAQQVESVAASLNAGALQ